MRVARGGLSIKLALYSDVYLTIAKSMTSWMSDT